MPGSSPEEAVTPADGDITQQVDTNSDGNVAASSTAEKDGGSMLDAVKSALKPKEASPTSEPDPAKASDPDTPPDGKTEDDEDALSEEELRGLKDKVQKRFSRLTSKLQAKDTEIGSLKPKAEELDKINGFIANAGLTAQDVSNLLTLGAMLKTDPKAAYERMLPTIRHLQSFMGEVLPPDLQKQVDDGFLTEAHAKELIAARNRAEHVDQRSQQERDAAEARKQMDETKRFTDATISSVETWEAKQAERDPDWSTKRGEVAELVELAIRQRSEKEGRPWFPNPEEAIQLSKDKLKTVEDRMKRFSPKPRSITPVDTAGASNRSTPKPSNMLEVVRQAVGR